MTVSWIPELSVIVITVYSSRHLERCLGSLETQKVKEPFETIAVTDDLVNNSEHIQKRFPWVRFYKVQGRTTEERLIETGIRHAQGKVVALTVDHCTAEENWCFHLLEEHKNPWAAIGGAIEKGVRPDTPLNWAIHFYDDCAFGYYAPPVLRGPAHRLSVCNVSYKMAALTQIREIWSKGFHVPAVNDALHARGETLWLSPDLIVSQHRRLNFGEAMHEPFGRGMAFAKMRAARSTPARHVVYAIFSPFLPALQMKRLFWNARGKKNQMGAVVKAFPFIILLSALWSWGEFLGYLSSAKAKER